MWTTLDCSGSSIPKRRQSRFCSTISTVIGSIQKPDCQGPAYLDANSHLPRHIFTTINSLIPRVRPDCLASQELQVESVRTLGCYQVSSHTRRLIPESEMIPVDRAPPDLGCRAPLHLERRDPK